MRGAALCFASLAEVATWLPDTWWVVGVSKRLSHNSRTDRRDWPKSSLCPGKIASVRPSIICVNAQKGDAMDFYINLRVNFRGNSKNFLLSGSETKSWESMEAMVRGRCQTAAITLPDSPGWHRCVLCWPLRRRRKPEVTPLNVSDVLIIALLKHYCSMAIERLVRLSCRMDPGCLQTGR